jgi:hypothetical protein
MSNIALITPDRGDRPEFLDHCRWQMERQTIKNLMHFVIDDPGIDGVVDIVPRIRKGIQLAKDGGFEYCFIIENDDYYPDNYIEAMMVYFNHSSGTDLLGLDRTIYYSLQSKSWKILPHLGRSSLFCTAFKISGLSNYRWPNDQLLYFDMHLWAHNCRKKLVSLAQVPIGMKHGTGFCPGNYHNGIVNGKKVRNMNTDGNLGWLKKRVRPESFEFYSKIIKSA